MADQKSDSLRKLAEQYAEKLLHDFYGLFGSDENSEQAQLDLVAGAMIAFASHLQPQAPSDEIWNRLEMWLCVKLPKHEAGLVITILRGFVKQVKAELQAPSERWISADESKPSPGNLVLARSSYPGKMLDDSNWWLAYYGHNYEGAICWMDDDGDPFEGNGFKVTHWRELPAKPVAESAKPEGEK